MGRKKVVRIKKVIFKYAPIRRKLLAKVYDAQDPYHAITIEDLGLRSDERQDKWDDKNDCSAKVYEEMHVFILRKTLRGRIMEAFPCIDTVVMERYLKHDITLIKEEMIPYVKAMQQFAMKNLEVPSIQIRHKEDSNA